MKESNFDWVSLRNVDWEQRRYEIAKEMLPVLFKEWTNVLRSGQNPKNPYQLIVSGAVKWADDLINELKKGGSHDTAGTDTDNR